MEESEPTKSSVHGTHSQGSRPGDRCHDRGGGCATFTAWRLFTTAQRAHGVAALRCGLALSLSLSWLASQQALLCAQDSSQEEGVVISRSLRDHWQAVGPPVVSGLSYLERKQRNGAVGSQFQVAVTSLAGLAALGAGYQPGEGPYGTFLLNCLNYLQSMEQRGSGYITESGKAERRSRMHGHCYAVLFLTQVAGSLPREKEQAVWSLIERGVGVIEQAQSSRGGWYYGAANRDDEDEASVTVGALQALRAARNVGVHVDAFRVRQAIRYVKECQGNDGSFAYSLREPGRRTFALTTAAVSTLNAAGVYESLELRKGLVFLRKSLVRRPRYVSEPWLAAEPEYRFYSNLYAAQAFYQDKGDLWERWYPKIRDYLTSRQQSTGPANGSWESNFGNEYATAMALLILEVPLGYLPIFQR